MSIARVCALTLLVALTAWPHSLSAQTRESGPGVWPGQTEGEFIIKDFHFNSGEVLPQLRLHYVTLGTLHRSSSGKSARKLIAN